MEHLLNIARYLPSSRVNGPGRRFTIWFQGCPFNCPGCFNQEYRQLKTARLITPAKLAGLVLGTSPIDGVTFSGGEPFFQAPALVQLALILKEKAIHILSYTGYTLEELRNSGSPAQKQLLDCIDMLIDGPYREELPKDRPYAGSANQKIHYLTAHAPGEIETVSSGTSEITISADGSIHLSGFPDQNLIDIARTLDDA